MEAAFYILMVYYTGFILALGIAMHNIKKHKTKANPLHAALLSRVIILFILVVYLLRAADWVVFRWKFSRSKNNKRFEALKAMFNSDNITVEARELPFYQLWFCWTKTLICLLLNRTDNSIMNRKMCIVTHNEYNGYESIFWSSVWISPYFFKDWSVSLYEDGC